MHKRNVKFNACQHECQLVNERLLLQRMIRACLVQQDDDRSETADTGICADDLKRCWLISNVVISASATIATPLWFTDRSSAVRGRAQSMTL